jgi:hypothetical protein
VIKYIPGPFTHSTTAQAKESVLYQTNTDIEQLIDPTNWPRDPATTNYHYPYRIPEMAKAEHDWCKFVPEKEETSKIGNGTMSLR